uniref:Cyclin-dependent kinases regulatory subunit n=1 Tax=Oryza brachyantha TaxID=4533 RepID=J3LJZ4_ORYBR
MVVREWVWTNGGFCSTTAERASSATDLEEMVRRMILEGLGVAKHHETQSESMWHLFRMSEYKAPNSDEKVTGYITHQNTNWLSIVCQNEVNRNEMQTTDGSNELVGSEEIPCVARELMVTRAGADAARNVAALAAKAWEAVAEGGSWWKTLEMATVPTPAGVDHEVVVDMGQIQYSEKYFDDTYEYRHVVLPPEVAKLLPKNRLLSENEWRAIGVQQSRGWVHYAIHRPEPHIMLFRRPLTAARSPSSSSRRRPRPRRRRCCPSNRPAGGLQCAKP